jgi:chaperonin GroEL (HSP60 family)
MYIIGKRVSATAGTHLKDTQIHEGMVFQLGTNPVIHPSMTKAEDAARRLSEQDHGTEIVIFEAIRSMTSQIQYKQVIKEL